MEYLILNPKALQLFMLIVMTARYREGWNERGLKINQCFVGRNYVESRLGISNREYRTAKAVIEKTGAATFKATNKGTIVTLSNTVACIFTGNESDTQEDTQFDTPNAHKQTDPRLTPDKPPTNPRHLTKKERKKEGEEEREEHTHPAGARGEEQAGSSAPAPDAGLPELVESIVDARCDWVLRAGDVELELLKCPKALRAEAVRQFIADVVNAIDPPDRPLGLLRKYMQNADRYSGNAPGKNNGGGRYVKPGRGDNDGPSGELPPPKMFDPENDPDREPDEFKPKPSKGLPQWIPPSERGDKVEAKSENEGGSK